MNITPGMKVVVTVDAQNIMVSVTEANLATVFTGRPFDLKSGKWGPPQVYTYEQVLASTQTRPPPRSD